MPSKLRRVTNAKLGLTRAPSAFALFCQHVKVTAVPVASKRRLNGKTLVNGKQNVLAKWKWMSPKSRDAFVQKAKQIAKENAAWRAAGCLQNQGAPVDTAKQCEALSQNCTFLWQGAALDCVDLLGSGAYGAVYRAKSPCGVEFAIKTPKCKDSFHNIVDEYERLRDLGSHPNVVPCHALLTTPAEPSGGLVLSLADGTMAMFVSSWPLQHGAPPSELAVRVRLALQLGLGVEYLRSKNVLHADLKPANILLQGDLKSAAGRLQLWISDFGLSRRFGKGQTSPANLVCTKQYRPVELLYHGKSTVVLKPSMDIWPCGCVFFELLAPGGHRLFEALPCTEGLSLPSDARDVTAMSCPPCVAHAKCCRVPSEPENLCQSGFSCKMNSRQNPKRFAQDIIDNPDPDHAASWEATKLHLRTRKPKFGLLEISTGCARGGGNSDPAIQSLLSELEEIKGMTCSSVCGNAHPLCTERARVLIFTSFEKEYSAQWLADEYQALAAKVANKFKTHHFKTFLSDASLKASTPKAAEEKDPTKIAQNEAKYHSWYAKALEKAISKSRLSAGVVSPPVPQRPSSTHPSLQNLGPWYKAQADVYYLICKQMSEQAGLQELAGVFIVLSDKNGC
eukprot:Skav201131  [mRNA]  locus=scaffold4373:198622:201533:+ [translate_table: standard]